MAKGLLERGFLKTLKILLWFAYLFALLQIGGLIYFHSPLSKPIASFGYPREIFVPQGDGMDYGYRPGFRGHFSGGTYNEIPLSINRDGYRDRDFATKDPARGTRVAVLGDSVVFGAGVPAEQRLTERLQALSTDAPAGAAPKSLEVLNLGVNSYGFSNYVAVMGSPLLRRLAPDLVILGFVVNDLEPSGWPRDVNQNWAGTQERFGHYLYNLAAVRLLCQLRDYAYYFQMAGDENEQYHTKYMRGITAEFRDPALLAEFTRNAARATALAQGLPARLLVALMPEINVLRDPNAFGIARTVPTAMLRQAGISVCDLYPDFAATKIPLDDLFLPHDDMHFSAAGHQLAAAGLRRCIQEAMGH